MLPKKKRKEKLVSVFVIETESEKEIEERVRQRMVRKIGRERQRLILSAREVAAVAESASRSKIQLESQMKKAS